MKKLLSRAQSSVPIQPLLSAILFVCYLVAMKIVLKRVPISMSVLFFLAVRALLSFSSAKSAATRSFKTKQLSLHLIFSFVSVALYYCLFGALGGLPLLNAGALYLSYPVFVPYLLRMWMGKRFDKRLLITSVLVWIALLFSFSLKFEWNIVSVLLGIIAACLQALYWIGHRKLRAQESAYTCWLYETLFALPVAAILIIQSLKSFNASWLILITGAALLEFLAKNALKGSKSSLLVKSSLFNLSIFLCIVPDLLFFHTFSPFKPLLCALLIYLALFLTFFQKNILPNPLYDL